MTSTGASAIRSGETRTAIIVETLVVFLAMLGFTWAAKSADLIGAGSIALWGGIILATLLMKRRGAKWSDYGFSLPKGAKQWSISIALTAAVIVTVFASMFLVIEPLTSFLGLEEAPTASDPFKFFLGKPLVFLGFIVVVVWGGAALGEELFLRGYLLNRLGDFFGHNPLGWTMALIIHAIIFGSMHVYQGFAGMIGTGIIGFIIGLYYLVGGRRLFPVIIAHGVINTVGLTAYYFSDGAIT
ncbi:CPBP family intramembrane glutamic endopeptidase [Marinicaulis aureus]|uniref:CPBP family intramembrane glutamic endopeptidase n=1 Tax=Hyphococcus aureus TaxID=2666033 RepID=A0ABW1KXZ7_9PROT